MNDLHRYRVIVKRTVSKDPDKMPLTTRVFDILAVSGNEAVALSTSPHQNAKITVSARQVDEPMSAGVWSNLMARRERRLARNHKETP